MPSLVGRDGELAAVDSFLSGVSGASALIVVGEPGIGKTTVWEEAVRRARERGALVLVARPTEAEAKLSFAALADLVSPIGGEAFGLLPDPQRHALAVALLRVDAAGLPPELRTVGTALLSLLRGLAAEREVVVAVDDVQWLDRASAAALEFAVRRLIGDRVRAILSVRRDAAGDAPLAAVPGAQPVELGPVSVASLHGIVSEQLGRSLARPALVRLAQASGGNPLYALELARLSDTADVAAALPVPEGMRTLVAKRIDALPDETRAALLRAASLARPDLRAVDADALAPAEEAGLVSIDERGRVTFAHPLFASAVYAGAPFARRRATHAALAEAVDDEEERARHLALSCNGPDPRVAQAVEAAGRRARARGASHSAVELYARALQLTADGDPERGRRRLGLAEQLLLAGDFERAGAELREIAGELPRGDARARALLMLADVEYWRFGESAALELEEEAARAADDAGLLARCHAMIAMHAGTSDVPRATAAAERALASLNAKPDADSALVSLVLSAVVRTRLFAGDGLDRDAAERALELERTAPPVAVDTRMNFKLGQWLRYVDDLDGARARLVEAETSARDEGDESSLPNILLNRTLAECWAGDLLLASELAEQTRDAFSQAGIAATSNAVWKAYVDAHLGRVDDVREAALARRDVDEPITRMLWDRSVGLAELSAGNIAAADRHLADAVRVLDEMQFAEPAVWRIHADAAEAALANGDVARGERLAAGLEASAARSRVQWTLAVSARCRALVHAAEGDLEEALAAVDRALAAHDGSPVPFERARTLLVQGQILRRLRQKRRARTAFADARKLFAALGAELWVARVDEELQRVVTRRAPDELSATELRIAQLAAAGRTNGEIAAEVFVTQKTVEANLARAYRKLGIRSRAQLAHALDGREPQANP